MSEPSVTHLTVQYQRSSVTAAVLYHHCLHIHCPHLTFRESKFARFQVSSIALAQVKLVSCWDVSPHRHVSPHTPVMIHASHTCTPSTSRRDCTPTSFFRVMNHLLKGFTFRLSYGTAIELHVYAWIYTLFYTDRGHIVTPIGDISQRDTGNVVKFSDPFLPTPTN